MTRDEKIAKAKEAVIIATRHLMDGRRISAINSGVSMTIRNEDGAFERLKEAADALAEAEKPERPRLRTPKEIADGGGVSRSTIMARDAEWLAAAKAIIAARVAEVERGRSVGVMVALDDVRDDLIGLLEGK